MKRQVGEKSLLTAQEHAFAGSTPDIIPPSGSLDWFKPQGLLTGKFTLREIVEARVEKGYQKTPLVGAALGITRTEGEVVGFALDAVDPLTGITVRDPRLILGKWDPDGRQLVGRDITSELLVYSTQMPEGERVEIPTRDVMGQLEGVKGRHSEKR